MTILAVLTAKMIQRVKTGKNFESIKSLSSFSPTAKHNRDLCAGKIKRITIVKRAMIRSNVLACKKVLFLEIKRQKL